MCTSLEKLPISVCVLCLNEADNLPKCLSEIDQFAEWLIFDTGSTDDSVSIAKKLGATVERHPWKGFAETRRIHFNRASQKWILWIDADEVITPEFVAELRTLFTQGSELPHQAYRLNRVMNFLGRWIRHGTWYPDRVCRLFRHDTWSMPQRAVHESLEINGTTGDMNSEVPHYSYQSWNQIETRGVHYAELWAAEKRRDKKSYSPIAPFTHAIWSFFRGTILKGGLLDGLLGIRIAWENAKVVYLKYRLLRS